MVLGHGRDPRGSRAVRPECAGGGLRDREDIDASKVKVTAQAVAAKRNDPALEQIVGRLSLEPNVSAATWQIDRSIPEA